MKDEQDMTAEQLDQSTPVNESRPEAETIGQTQTVTETVAVAVEQAAGQADDVTELHETDVHETDVHETDVHEIDLTEGTATVTAEVSEPIGVDSQISMAEARRAVEAILMVADQPVPSQMLGQLLEVPTDAVEALCHEMAADYESLGHGFQLVMVAGGWRFQSHPALTTYVERFALDGQVSRLSAAALETLAIVAYKQPISRAQIAQIRGVNVDGVMRTLVQRGYVAEIGTDPGPGQASLFGTTTKFLEGVGLGSLADLAPLADFVPGAEILDALEAGLRVDTTVDTTIDGPVDAEAAVQESTLEPILEPILEPTLKPAEHASVGSDPQE